MQIYMYHDTCAYVLHIIKCIAIIIYCAFKVESIILIDS